MGNDFTNPTIAKSGFRVHWPFLHMYGGIFASFKYLTGDTNLSSIKSHCPGIFTYKNANPEKQIEICKAIIHIILRLQSSEGTLTRYFHTGKSLCLIN